MPIAEWTAPFTLTSPGGDIDFNVDSGSGEYRLVSDQCQVGVDLRITTDGLPQADGEVLHRRFKTGQTMRLVCQLLKNGEIAIGDDLVTLWAALTAALEGIRNPAETDTCRIQWTPTGSSSDRALDRIRLLEAPSPAGLLPKLVTFAVDTRYPYAIDLGAVSATITPSPSTIHNGGNTDSYPIVRLNGPFSFMQIQNLTTGLSFTYDDTLPGAVAIASGHYLELDMFEMTARNDGDPGESRKAGIDVYTSDFFPLAPGDNSLETSAGTATVLWNAAFA